VWTARATSEKHTGEICIRGPQVMKGYWQHPRKPPSAAGRWLKTGDLGHMDPRATSPSRPQEDMILVSGFNVYPNEIESVVATHPGVLECGGGVPDAKSARR